MDETRRMEVRAGGRREYTPERARRDRRLGWLNAFLLATLGLVHFGGRFLHGLLAAGDASTWWALGASLHLAGLLALLFWSVAIRRGGADRLPGWPVRLALTAAIVLVVTASCLSACWIVAGHLGHPLRL